MENLSFLDDENKNLLVNFTVQYVELLKEQKENRKRMKSLCKEFNEMGLPTKLAIRAFNRMIDEKHKDIYEENNIESFKDILISNQNVQDAYTQLEEEN